MKNKRPKKNRIELRKKIIFSVIILLVFFSFLHSTFAQYQNQEKIPGAAQTTSIVQYIKDIINFGFAVIGILALFMLIIGAYQYLMAAGNIGKADSAKETISSALLGLILGLCAYIVLYKINPDLVAFRSISSLSSSSSGSKASTASSTSPSTNAGECVAGTGKCAESNLSCFGSAAKNASIVCRAESGEEVTVGGDKCGSSYVSYGLFQVNVTCHDLGMNCTSAFNGCLGTNVSKSTCSIISDSLYKKCVSAMQDETTNIQAACSIYKSGGWSQWSAAKKCGIS